MKIVFLGTNGWYDTKVGNTISTFVETDKFNLIFDAGNGLYKLDRYVNFNKPAYLFISHLHIDHIEGLHTLNKIREKLELKIYCSENHIDKLKVFLDSPFTMPPDDLRANVSLCSFKEGEYNLPFPVTIKKLSHADEAFGFRVNLDGKILTYCCDTSVCESDRQLSQNADLLIHESSLLKKIEGNAWGHSSPIEVVEMAIKQKVKKLGLTHFSANLYTSIKQKQKIEKEAQGVFANTFVAMDDLEITI